MLSWEVTRRTKRIPSCDDVGESFGVEAKVAVKTPRPEAVLQVSGAQRKGGVCSVVRRVEVRASGASQTMGEDWGSYSKGSSCHWRI